VISTGYSVLMPLLAMCTALLVYGYLALKRDYLAKRFKVKCPYPSAKAAAGPLAEAFQKIREHAEELHHDLRGFVVCRRGHGSLWLLFLIVFVPPTLLLAYRARPTPEGWIWDYLFFSGFVCLGALVLIGLLRFLAGWKRLEEILKRMALIPMVGAFDRLPRKTAALFGGYFFARRPRVSHLAIPLHLLQQLHHDAARASAASAAAQSSTPAQEEMPSALASCLRSIQFAHEQTTHRKGALDPEYPGKDINALSRYAQQMIVGLEAYWPRHTVADAYGEQAKPSEAVKKEGETPPSMPHGVEKAEDFVAIQLIIFLSQYFILLRTMALSTVWVAVLLLLAATAYPFQPEQLILYLLLGLLGAVVAGVLWVMVRINKNEIVSRITQSTPNKFEFNWTFIQATVQFVGPVAIVVAAQLSGRLRTVLEPFMDLIK